MTREGDKPMTQPPLVSIGMAIYNEEKYLAETIDNLLHQHYDNFELIISDNGSTDNTGAICREFAAKDGRIKYRPLDKTVTAVENFNRVFRLAEGEFFMWAAGHDRYDPDFIRLCLDEMLSDPKVVLCYPLIQPMTHDGKMLNVLPPQISTQGLPGALLRSLVVAWHIGGYDIHGLLRADAVKKTRMLVCNTIGPDFIFLSELSLYGAFALLRKPLYFPRLKWNEQNTAETMARYSERAYFWKKNGGLRFPTWRYYGEHLRMLLSAPLGILKKSAAVLLFTLIFFKYHFTTLRSDLIRPFRNAA